MADGLKAVGMTQNAYGFFMEGWAYRFYPIVLLFFVFSVALTGRDFGPMRVAEGLKHPSGDEPEVDEPIKTPNRKRALWGAIVPVVALVLATLLDLYVQGVQASKNPAETPLFELIGSADGYNAMMRGGILGWLLAVCGALLAGGTKVKEATEHTIEGMKYISGPQWCSCWPGLWVRLWETSGPPITRASWAKACPAGCVPPPFCGRGHCFATGTSFGTMEFDAHRFPLVVGIAPGEAHLLLASAASVLAGACFGDHCSPISDTTVCPPCRPVATIWNT